MLKYILAALLWPALAIAQDNKADIGIRGAFTYTSLSGFSDPETQGTVGFSGGFTAGYHLTERFSINTGLDFTQKGFSHYMDLFTVVDPKTGATSSAGISNEIFKQNYFIVPVLARYAFGQTDWKFYAEAGVYAGYLINTQYILYAEMNGHQTRSTGDYTSQYNHFDAGPCIGFGMEKKINDSWAFEFGVRYELGLMNAAGHIYKFDPSDPEYEFLGFAIQDNNRLTNQAMSLTGGFKYRL